MSENEKESGHELILDNRKLIIAFVILIVVCGSFFVVGFLEGKRQGYQEGFQAEIETAPSRQPPGSQAQVPESGPAEPDSTRLMSDPDEAELNWYRSVNRRNDEPEILMEPPRIPAAAKSNQPPAAKPAQQKTPAAAEAVPAEVTYSVQIGAFKAHREAEIAAEQVRSKGFDCRIKLPESPDGLFLVKVGMFNSRAEAMAMQSRLQENGFNTFIKIN
ncbi:MAG TPA: SPOR domain-containing protein [Acidobacteriota bacterium]|nr:SPOR domain-containing protein [Acidobacteriota bacterium]